MAALGGLEAFLGGLDDQTKKALTLLLRALVPNLRFGPVDHQQKLENFQSYYESSTTPSVANTEFSIAHGMGRTPYLAMPVLALDSVGAQTVRLTVSKAADSQRIYLKSSDTSAPIFLLVE